MTPTDHIKIQKARISRAELEQQGCSPAVAEAILIAAAHPDTGRQVLHMNLEYARSVADKAALLGALAFLRNQHSLEIAA
jgi:acyl-coenzyme A synthetase/AMP-(fatty) acid ligase